NMFASNHPKTGSGIKKTSSFKSSYCLFSGIDDICIFFSFERKWSHPENSVFALKFYIDAFRDIISNQSWDSDSQVYEISDFKFLCNSFSNSYFIYNNYARFL